MAANPSIPSRAKHDNQLLGNDRKIRVPKLPDEASRSIESTTEYRYRLQSLARNIIWHKDMRLFYCLRRPAPGCSHVVVQRDTEKHTAGYRNLELCNRVWTCPVCAARIANERRRELSDALAAAKIAGYMPVLVTYTVRHDGRDRLGALLDGLQASLRAFKSGRAWQDIKREYGVLGGVRALEVTFGEYGWHPHIHELMFLDEQHAPRIVAGLRQWLAERWRAMLEKQGYDASWEHGIDVRTADSQIADYIAKYGHEPREHEFGVEHEVAYGNSKKAHRDGLTAFQLLEAYGNGDQQARELFEEYAGEMDGRRQLVWSAGLRALLALPEPVEDEQLPGFEETPATYTAVEFTQENWYEVIAAGLRGVVLFLVAAGDWTTLDLLFKRHEIEAVVHREPPESVDVELMTPARGATEIHASQMLMPGLPEMRVRYD